MVTTETKLAGPVFKKVAEYMLYKKREFNQLAITNTKAHKENFVAVKTVKLSPRNLGKGRIPNFVGLDKRSAVNLAQKFNIGLVKKGIGIVEKQIPAAGDATSKFDLVQLFFSPPYYE